MVIASCRIASHRIPKHLSTHKRILAPVMRSDQQQFVESVFPCWFPEVGDKNAKGMAGRDSIS
jgi:hypothetical protein